MAAVCRLFGAFGWFVQGLLGILCFSSLFVKRYREHPRRKWVVFLMDATKQAASTAFAHVMNVLIAMTLSKWEEDSQCVWYFINIVIDCSVGVFFAYLLLKLITTYALRRGYERLRSGEYFLNSDTPDFKAWGIQLAAWCFIVFVTKWTLVGFIYLFRSMLSAMGEYFLSPFAYSPELELVVVMVVIPTIMNIIQFWIQDNFLMSKPQRDHGKLLIELHSSFESIEELN
mmetsp:Transcript_22518/g.40573  ORF Transcript_22518/g.40573 Transcript_22518/m.40573 type:complete len:229 (-) Transcript_22518:1444-2130(-)